MTDWIDVNCPYCGESFETAIEADPDAAQQYVEDCAVCCRPIVFRVSMEDGVPHVRARRDDDSS